MVQHFVNVSGGKDSGACLELAIQRGIKFRAIMADTDNESPITIDHIGKLSERLKSYGHPPVELIKNDFKDRIAKKREFVSTKWREQGVPEKYVLRALAVLQPTGNAFLDLCIWKGRFPSRMAQFCTEFLKQEAIWNGVLRPALEKGPAIQWLGVRRDEGQARRSAPMWRTLRTKGMHRLQTFSPIIHWTAQNAVGYTIARGGPVNPLYRQGFSRVGCFPCINASKNEIAKIAIHHPDQLAIKAEWEEIVAQASKRGGATFFASKNTPKGRNMVKEARRVALARARRENPSDDKDVSEIADRLFKDMQRDMKIPNIVEVGEYAKTARGGAQLDWIRQAEMEETGCSSEYGLCE